MEQKEKYTEGDLLKMANLILVRHGQSLWNAKGLWTGLTDVSLSEKGIDESKLVGNSLKDIRIDIVFTSVLKRAKETLDEIKKKLGINSLPTIENQALNEKNYGVFTGKNKWEVKKEYGIEKFTQIRRGWSFQIPNGESLKDVYNRAVPYYQKEILPRLKEGKNVLVVAHGNSLRALVKYLENVSDHDIENLELATGEIYIYKVDENGKVISKEKLLS